MARPKTTEKTASSKYVSRLTHEITILPPGGVARQIAPGEVVDFAEEVGLSDEGQPLTLGECLEGWQREQFEGEAQP